MHRLRLCCNGVASRLGRTFCIPASTAAPATPLPAAAGVPASASAAASARVRELRGFWAELGLPHGPSLRLARLAASEGTAWSRPDVLRSRLAALRAELPSLPLPLLLSDAPGLLLYRPRRLREKLDALRDLLPAADLLRLVRRAPDMLSRDMAKLEDRLAALGGLEGADAPTLAAEHPRLLREDAAMLRERVAVLRRAFSPTLLRRVPRDRLALLLTFPPDRLSRLEYLSAVYPGVRGHVGDLRLVRMKTHLFRKAYRPRRLTPAKRNALRRTTALGPVRPAAEVPAGANAFREGERQLARWRADLAREIESERRAPRGILGAHSVGRNHPVRRVLPPQTAPPLAAPSRAAPS
uniref:Uncharacterized protein n=1 Tax=Emiliania huxleyi TaxID=2903 RepID=A0A7S3W4N7_EMIHU